MGNIYTNFESFIKNLMANIENRPSELRKGQWIFNTVYEEYPEIANHFRNSEHDCFYNDAKINDFIISCMVFANDYLEDHE